MSDWSGNYDVEALAAMNAVARLKGQYETALAAGAEADYLLKFTADANAKREWLSGHGYGWAASALGYSARNAAEAYAWIDAEGAPRLRADGYLTSKGVRDSGKLGAPVGGSSDPAPDPDNTTPSPWTGSDPGEWINLPSGKMPWWGWLALILGGLVVVKSAID